MIIYWIGVLLGFLLLLMLEVKRRELIHLEEAIAFLMISIMLSWGVVILALSKFIYKLFKRKKS